MTRVKSRRRLVRLWQGGFGPILGVIVLIFSGCSHVQRLPGTDLQRFPAPDFTLHDADGTAFSLSDFRGKPVLLTFLYANCPDICPAIAGKLAALARQLGPAMKNTAFVAVSVDPDGDTSANVSAFNREHGLDALGKAYHYGIGSRAELAAVWHLYGIGAEPQPAALSALRPSPDAPPVIDHNAVLYLIDARGVERRLMEPDVTVAELARGLQAIRAK